MSKKYPAWWENLVKERKAEGLKAGDMVAIEPQLFKRFMDHLSRFVVHDVSTKTLVFFTALSAYTKNPLNLFLRGESSIGKTYNVTQTLMYFPEEDTWFLGGLSPTALVHDYGILADRNNNEIDFSEKPSPRKPKKRKKESVEDYTKRLEDWKQENKRWREKMQGARYIVDLHNKILVFLEAPHVETYNRLRPILSHDREEISYKFTGKELRTMHVVIKGWPATVFLSTEEEYIEDLATRSFTVTPETHETKIRNAIRLRGKEKALPWKYERGPEWMLLHGYIGFLTNQLQDLDVVNPFARELAECYPAIMPRCMRDFDHVTALIDVSAFLHCHQRPVIRVGEEKRVLCTIPDLRLVLKVLPDIEETTVTGLPTHILECFHKIMEPLYQDEVPFNYETLTEKYNEVFRRKRSSSTLRRYVMLLSEVGYVDTMPDPVDKRKKLITVIKNHNENTFDSVIQAFSGSFSLEKFKEWFNDVKNYVHGNHVVLMRKLTAENEVNIEEIYEHHYSPTLLDTELSRFSEQIFPEGSKRIEGVKPQKKAEDVLRTEKSTIQESVEYALEMMTKRKPEHTTGDDFIHDLKWKGKLRDEEARKLFDGLLEEGKLAYDLDGWLVRV